MLTKLNKVSIAAVFLIGFATNTCYAGEDEFFGSVECLRSKCADFTDFDQRSECTRGCFNEFGLSGLYQQIHNCSTDCAKRYKDFSEKILCSNDCMSSITSNYLRQPDQNQIKPHLPPKQSIEENVIIETEAVYIPSLESDSQVEFKEVQAYESTEEIIYVTSTFVENVDNTEALEYGRGEKKETSTINENKQFLTLQSIETKTSTSTRKSTPTNTSKSSTPAKSDSTSISSDTNSAGSNEAKVDDNSNDSSFVSAKSTIMALCIFYLVYFRLSSLF
ncbi:hypothetical protein BB558_003808 [Smittium angustum]|uniref:WSC domain-containing protein n=1 Tax=Smittium angustum TaxID=133377 RepID=A0A2U1J4Z0_SMIAN|nr:hypothetical protein BB558_003808 [Smittium angustum]